MRERRVLSDETLRRRSVTLSTATCYGGALCTVADNMPGDFAAQVRLRFLLAAALRCIS